MIEVIIGDIVEQKTDAIVNSANPTLLAGSGISGAIHRAAGPDLERECIGIGPCPEGEARITGGYNLPARYVIHAVAPKYWDGTRGEVDCLRAMYKSIFQLVEKHGIKSVSIPVIGVGINRFPLELAAKTFVENTKSVIGRSAVLLVCFDQVQFDIFERVVKVQHLN